jgi:putative hydrolase of the HAD superfamily
MTRIKVILFDADGVIQNTRSDFLPRLKSLLGERNSDADLFIADIFAAERPCLSGAADFADVLAEVLKKWQISQPIKEVLMIWDSLSILPGIEVLIENIRRRGVICCLATNQQTNRAAFMKRSLGYDKLFDRQFYSCEMGVVKPDVIYFQSILRSLQNAADEILFVDDKPENIEAAESQGIHGLQFDALEYEDPSGELLKKMRSFDKQIGAD